MILAVGCWLISAISLTDTVVGVASGAIPVDAGQRWVNVVTVIGTVTSLVAFVVMLQQFRSVKKTTNNVKKEVGKIAAIADLSQFAERVRSIYGDICDKEYKLAAFKLESVQEALVSVKSKMTDSKKIQQYTRVISTVSVTKTTLQEKDICEDNLNFNKIGRDLEKVITFLQEEKYEMVK